MTIEVGMRAPDFALQDQHGQTVRLSQFRGDKHVLLVFDPWSFTGICTSEMGELRDALPGFERGDTQLLAVSCDAMQTQRVFADCGAALRGTFVIDRDGVVQWRVVNGIGEARTLSDCRTVLGDLVG